MTPQELIPHLAAALAMDPAAIRFLRYSQNRVYEWVDACGIARILRVTEDSHRTRKEIQSETDWLLHLHRAGLSVCPPVQNGEGEMIHSLTFSGSSVHVVIFEKATGHAVTKEDLTSCLYERHGRHLGRLHALSRKSPASSLTGRRPWDRERYFTTDIPLYLPEAVQASVHAHFQKLQRCVEALPATPENFGPCHLDLGYANFFLRGDLLELFDFDNCTRSYFAADIAAALYGSLFTGLRCEFAGDRSCFEPPKSGRILEQVWAPFRRGYLSESPWPESWNKSMSAWFEIMYLRAVVHAFRIQHPVSNPKIQAALDADIQNILNVEMPLRFDFLEGMAEK